MKKILFICYGNICRSPMAEFIFKKLVKERGLDGNFHIESVATSREEIGNDIYYLAKQKLKEKGVPFTAHRARQLRIDDYDNFDYLIGMEKYNIDALKKIVGIDYSNKVTRLLDYTDNPRDIADPWGTGLFEKAYQEIYEGCEALLAYLTK